MYADRKGWPLRQTTVRLRHRRIHASDCADCETRTGQLDRIDRELQFEGELTEEQRARLLDIAERCPVHRTLHFRGARHNGREHSGSAWRLKRSN
jgi:putative redox protein